MHLRTIYSYVLLHVSLTVRVSAQKMTDEVKQALQTPILLLGEGCGYEGCPVVKEGMLNVHIVPHSHGELGHTKTFYQHYTGEDDRHDKSNINWKRILDSTITELWNHAFRKFTLSDMPYFFHWWMQRDGTVHRMVYQLIRQGRLHIVGGGWGMPDETCTSYHALIDQFTLTLRKINQTFGPCGRPLVAWQADNFGHTREFANLAAMLGFDALFINPISYEDEVNRMTTRELEMVWRGSDELGPESEIFTHKLFDGYWSPPGFCFDGMCSDPLIITSDTQFKNVEERVNVFIDSVKNRQSSSYNTSHIMVVMGRRMGYHDAPRWFQNIDTLIDHVNEKSSERGDQVYAMYSAPACYLKAVYDSKPVLPIKQDDFVPITFDKKTHLTGLFTSRPTIKYMAREGHVFLQMAKQMHVLAKLPPNMVRYYDELNWMVAAFQDHNIITGAMRPHVKNYYTKKMYVAVQRSTLLLKKAFNLLRNSSESLMYYRCSFNISSCRNINAKQSFILIYNPLSWSVTVPVRIPVIRFLRHVVFDPDLKIVKSVSMKMPSSVLSLPHRDTTADHEVVFMAENLPPMGFRSYYIETMRIPRMKKRRSIIKQIRRTPKKKYLSRQTDQMKIDDASMLESVDAEYQIDAEPTPAMDDENFVKPIPKHIVNPNSGHTSDYDKIKNNEEENEYYRSLKNHLEPYTTTEDFENAWATEKTNTRTTERHTTQSTLLKRNPTNKQNIPVNDNDNKNDTSFSKKYKKVRPPAKKGIWRYSTTKDAPKILPQNPYLNKQIRKQNIKHPVADNNIKNNQPKILVNIPKKFKTNQTRKVRPEENQDYHSNMKHDDDQNQITQTPNPSKTPFRRFNFKLSRKDSNFTNKNNKKDHYVNDTPVITIAEVYKTNLNKEDVTKLHNLDKEESKTLKRYVGEDISQFPLYDEPEDEEDPWLALNRSKNLYTINDKISSYLPSMRKVLGPDEFLNLFPVRTTYETTTSTTAEPTVETTTEYDPLKDPYFDENKHYFYRVSKDKFIKNKYVKVHLNDDNEVSKVSLSNGVEVELNIQICYYASDDPVKLGRPDDIKPGPNVFKPMDPTPVVIKELFKSVVHKTYLVEEVQYTLANWASFVLRLYVEKPTIELDWVVGPVPTADDIGKDVFIRYSTNLTTEGVFYTDSNGRQTVKRVRNARPTYQPFLVDIPSNFYPVTSKIYIEDVQNNIRFSVFNDRAQGGTSLKDGQIDLMIHRRILTSDDDNESFLDDTEFGQGIVVRGKHILYISKADYKPNKIFEKKLAKEIELAPQIFASPFNGYGENTLEKWSKEDNEFQGLFKRLPTGIHVLTLQEWDHGTILLRLENILEQADMRKSAVKTVTFDDLFENINILSVRETTLGGNVFLEDDLPLYWRVKNKFVKNFNDFYYGNGTVEYDNENIRPREEPDINKGITLHPQQIRTFIVSYDNTTTYDKLERSQAQY